MSGVRVKTTKQRPAQNVNQHTVTTNRPQPLRDESPWAAAETLCISNSDKNAGKFSRHYSNSGFLPKLAQKSIVIHPD